jgi:RND family efflux transporter MFP subunit
MTAGMFYRRLGVSLLAPVAIALSACEGEPREVVEKIRAIKTVTVAERGSGQLNRFPGLIEAVDTSVISFEVAGNTREVNVNVGDRVTEGQIIATLDESQYQLNVELAEAEVGRAKAVLAEKQNEYDRQNTLYKKEWVSKAAFDQAVAARDSAANGLAYANSKLNLALRDKDKTLLQAPFDGVIAAKYAEPYQEVARGEKIFEIYIEGAMEVVLNVPETKIGEIYQGLPAEVSFPAENIEALAGRVSEVGSVASTANAFPVKVVLANPPPGVLPGMTAEASLVLGSEGSDSSFLVPFSAIAPGDDPGRGYIFVFDSATSTVRRTPVKGKGVRDDRVMINEGLEAGDVIAIAGVSFLRDGQKVKLMSE